MFIFEWLGNKIITFLNNFGLMTRFFLQACFWMFRKPFRVKNLTEQMVKVGIETLPVALITSSFTGMIFVVQLYYALKGFGLEAAVSSGLALAVIRELAPVLAGLVMAGRVGAAMAAELGSMKVTDQIDALKTMAVDPIHYLVSPRILATIIMMTAITTITDFMGIFGGYVVGTVAFDLNPYQFYQDVIYILEPWDIFASMVKAAVFGLFISTISCYEGFNSKGGAEGVGEATTNAVVTSMIILLIVDYLLNLILW
ncbi:MAG: ABC transporter permease [bacterium]|nr:ABC transporter permease [bacterium]